MNDDDIDLAQRLCARAGMIMEDASVEAIVTARDVDALQAKLERLRQAAELISTLIQAADALISVG